MQEYFGRCPLCKSYNISTEENYEKPTGKGTEIHYICVCNDCNTRFDAKDEERIDE